MKQQMNNNESNGSLRQRAIVMMLSASILWSIGGLLIKLVNLNPLAIAGMRSLIASIVVFGFLDKSTLSLSWNKVLGAISYASMVILFVSATKATTAANAILLQYTSPIYIAIFGGWLLKEKAVLKDWVVIVSVLCGMVLFFIDDISGGSLVGTILAVFSGIAMAFSTIFMRRQKDADPLENVFWGSILTVIVCLPFMFESMPDTKSWVGLVLLGVFQLGFSYVLYARAIKNITALQSTFICLVEPLLNPVWVFLSVGEAPGVLSVIGGLIVLVSVTIGCIKPSRKSVAADEGQSAPA